MYATLSLPAPCDLASMPKSETLVVHSADELRSAMRQSRARPIALDASGLDRILRLDLARGLLEVQSATTWASLAAWPALDAPGLDALARAAGMPATVGAALAENAAGPDGVPMARHVHAFVLVTPEGELRRVNRETHPDLFRLVAGGQDVFGMLYSVTLDIESLRRSAACAHEPAELVLSDEPPAQGRACEVALLLPPEQLERFLGEVRALASDRRLALQSISVRRTVAEDESRLRWARRDWAAVRVRFGVRASLGAAVHAAETRRGLLALALGCGGSFPVSDLRDATRAQLEACYPEISAFVAEKRRCDPAERLQNAWFRKACAILRGESRWSAPG
ncbi:MAG: FAD-binding protein [Betaproteobacteria bacterium]